MGAATLEKQLKSGELAPFYLLHGAESYLTAHYAKALAERAAGEVRAFNLHRFTAETFNLSRLTAAVENLPLMAQRSCVLLWDVAPEALGQGEWKEYRALLENAPQTCVLVLAFVDVPFDKKNARCKALLALAQKRGAAEEFAAPPRGELKKWLARRVKEAGASIGAPAADALADACGSDMGRMAMEADKLAAFRAGGEIAPEDVAAMVAKDLDSSIYDLARQAVAGRLPACLSLLDELFEQKIEPVVILSALSQAFCDLYRAAVAVSAGVEQAQIAADFPYKGREFRIRNALRDCRGLSVGFLRAALSRLLAADAAVKSGADGRLALERLCVDLDALRRRAAVS